MSELGRKVSYIIGKQFIHKYASIFDLAEEDGYSLDYLSTVDINRLEDIVEEAYEYWVDNCGVKVDKLSFMEGALTEILMYRQRDYYPPDYFKP